MCFNSGHSFIYNISSDTEQQLENIVRRIALDLHRGVITAANIDQQLLATLASSLWAGVEFGYPIPEEATLSQWKWFNKARESVYLFSGAKTYAQLQEFSALLSDAAGNLRPFSEYLKDVLAVHKTYNVAYLQAEYNHAVATAQMSQNWNDYIENIDVAPFLKYITAGDDHVRPEHAVMDGVIKRKDDPFWNTWYPPNGWNCRCDVSEELDDEDGLDPGETEILPPPMFRTNVGKTGVVFPDKHPYLQEAQRQEVMDKITKAGYEVMHKNAVVIPVKTKNGIIQINSMADATEVEYNLKMAERLREHTTNVVIREHFIKHKKKNPELIVNGEIADFKKPANWKAIKNSLKEAHAQSCSICVVDATNLSLKEIDKAYGKINANFGGSNNANIKSLYIIHKDGLIMLERENWNGAYFQKQIQQ